MESNSNELDSFLIQKSFRRKLGSDFDKSEIRLQVLRSYSRELFIMDIIFSGTEWSLESFLMENVDVNQRSGLSE